MVVFGANAADDAADVDAANYDEDDDGGGGCGGGAAADDDGYDGSTS